MGLALGISVDKTKGKEWFRVEILWDRGRNSEWHWLGQEQDVGQAYAFDFAGL
jgi:hypothetical protein